MAGRFGQASYYTVNRVVVVGRVKCSTPARQALFMGAKTGDRSLEEGRKGILPRAGTKLLIDRIFNHNQQVNSASSK